MRTVLFICTGNTCRSPMAEAIARHALERERHDEGAESWFVASAGVAAADGVPTTRETVEALRRLGIEFEGRSKPLSREMIEKADHVLCMTRAHAQTALRLVDDDPDEASKISTLHPERDIEDPVGMGQEVYDQLASELTEIITERLEELLKHHADRPGL